MTQKNIHKIFTPQKIFIFLKTPKNIEIQNFDPKKMVRAYVCMKISEYSPPLGHANVASPSYIMSTSWSIRNGQMVLETLGRFFLQKEGRYSVQHVLNYPTVPMKVKTPAVIG